MPLIRPHFVLFAFAFIPTALCSQSQVEGPDLGPIQKTESDFTYHEIAAAESGHRTKLWIYLPQETKPGATPCVVIAPAGTRMFHGLGLAAGDQDEHTPWVEAGFVVVAYEIASRFDDAMPDKKVIENIEAFVAAKSGVENGKEAVSFAKELPQVDPERIYTAGHSSAGTLALQLTSADSRIAGCVAFAPVVDLDHHLTDHAKDLLNGLVRGSANRIIKRSPHLLTSKLRRPLYLFIARDDDVAPVDRLATFAEKLSRRNKRVVLQYVAKGGHYEPMIETGISSAIKWVQGGMKATATVSGTKEK